MSTRAWRWTLVLATFGVAVVAGCGDDTASGDPFELRVFPEFVQGAIPGAATGVLVTIAGDSNGGAPVAVTASAVGADVSVTPTEIRPGETAEVTVVADPATAERPLEIMITAERGDNRETATKNTTVYAWEDDREVYAKELLEVFRSWLAEHQPGVGIDATTEFSGSFVAPGLLVVSHYMFTSDEWELGLSWHVMVPPDDWAEIYLRPRDETTPTLAFRLQSQAAALNEGLVAISAVAPPPEVVR
jgi:hypothetical protein